MAEKRGKMYFSDDIIKGKSTSSATIHLQQQQRERDDDDVDDNNNDHHNKKQKYESTGSVTSIIGSRLPQTSSSNSKFTSNSSGRVLDSGTVVFPPRPKSTVINLGSSSSSIPNSSQQQTLLNNIKFEDGVNQRQNPPGVPRIRDYVGGDVTVTRFNGNQESSISITQDQIRDTLKELLGSIEANGVFSGDNVMKFLSAVAGEAGKKNGAQEFYKTPAEILKSIPGGQAFITTFVAHQIERTYKPQLSNAVDVKNEISTKQSYTARNPDLLNIAIHTALSPENLGRIIIKDYYNGIFDIAFETLRGRFPNPFALITKKGTLMNSSNSSLRTFFGIVCGLEIKLRDLDNGQLGQFQGTRGDKESALDLAYKRLGDFKMTEQGLLIDSRLAITNNNNDDRNSRFMPNFGRGPSYTSSSRMDVRNLLLSQDDE